MICYFCSMNFNSVYADSHAIEFLEESIVNHRISHAQLFIGKPGWGTFDMALAYAKALIGGNNVIAQQKVENLIHPDLHFSIPTFKVDKKEALTKNYIQEYKQLLFNNHFASLSDWYDRLEAGNKQGFLSKNEIMEVSQTLSLKSYEGGYKVLIIWNADKMKVDYANKFLKLLEEPPEKTLFILLSEGTEYMLDTITSRCVSVNFKPLQDTDLENFIKSNYEVKDEEIPLLISKSQGDI